MIVKSSARLIASVDQALATRPRGAVEIRVRVRRIDAQRLDAEVRGVDLDPEHGASVPRWVCVARVVGRVDGLAVPGIACVIFFQDASASMRISSRGARVKTRV